MVAHSFNPSTPVEEADGSLSLRLAWSIDQIPGQPSLGSEGNHQKQKSSEDIIEWWGYVLAPASSRTWQLHGVLVLESRMEERVLCD